MYGPDSQLTHLSTSRPKRWRLWVGVCCGFWLIAITITQPPTAGAQFTARNALDANYFLRLNAGNPEIAFDANDLFSFNRGINTGVFFVNSIAQLTFSSTGIGIGTTSTQQTLQVNGDVQLEASAGTTVGNGSSLDFRRSDGWNPVRIEQLFSGATSQGSLVFLTNNGGAYSDITEKMRLDHQGFLGIGTTPTQMLDVNGQVRIRGGTPGAGKVLTSDATGVASWEAPSSGANTTRVFFVAGPAGCTQNVAAGVVLLQQSFTTSAAATPIKVMVDNVARNTTRTDTFLWVNGVAVRNDLTDTASVDWQSVDIKWGGTVGPGTHTVQFTAGSPNVIGCGAIWGGMTTVVHGPP